MLFVVYLEADLLSPTQIHQEEHSITSLSEDNNGDAGLKQLTSANNTNTNDITTSTRSQPTSEHRWDQEDDLSDIVLQNETDKMSETDIQSSHEGKSFYFKIIVIIFFLMMMYFGNKV